MRDMFHNSSLNNNLSDWEKTLSNNEDFVETILEPKNSFDDHADTMVQREIVADARFISEGESKISHSIEAGRDHSYNEYTAHIYLEMPSTHLYHHQKSNISPNKTSHITAQRQHTNPRPSVLEPNLVVDASDNSKSKPYVDHKYKDFNKVNERLDNWSSCIVGEKPHAIVSYGGTLGKDCLDNLYSRTKVHDNSYFRNNICEKVVSFNVESSASSSRIGEDSLHYCESNRSPNISYPAPARNYICVQPEYTISKPSAHDASLVTESRDISKKKQYVDHTYIDFSKVDDRSVDESSRIVGEKLYAIFCYGGALSDDHRFVIDGTKPRSKKRRWDNFPSRLMMLLSDDPDPSIISWLPHGRSFIVKDQKRFMDEVHPLYFRPSKFKTFQRMLSLWGMKVMFLVLLYRISLYCILRD